MPRLTLDYQASPPVDRVWLATLLAAVAVLGLLLAMYVDVVYELESAIGAVNSLPTRQPKGDAAGGRDAGAAQRLRTQEIDHARRVLHEISLPWDALFEAVEGGGGKDVALLGLEPDADKARVKIVGEARNLGATLDYLRQLQHRSALRDVFLQQHQVESQDPDKPVRFTIVAGWAQLP